MGSRTIVVGDVHGCLEELDELLSRLEVRPSERLVLAGDLMDRGPDPVGVVRRARERGALAVLGNHDEKHLRFARHEAKRRADPRAKNPMKSFTDEQRAQNAALSREDLAWLGALPLFLRLEPGLVVVHAGLLPGRAAEGQPTNVYLRLRHVNTRGDFVELGREGTDTAPWATRWTGPESVIYGHDVHGLETHRRDEPLPGVVCLGIDTGCCFGGRLTAVVLPGFEIVQVPARKAYARRTLREE